MLVQRNTSARRAAEEKEPRWWCHHAGGPVVGQEPYLRIAKLRKKRGQH